MAWISFVLALLISSSSAFLSSLTTTTTTTTRRNQRTSSVTQIHAEPHTQFTPLSCENETIESVPNRTSSVPFPRSSYHLSRLEDNIQYQFVSFIDHFDDSYTQVSRLVEPRRYARSNQFYGRKPTTQPPTIDDVACPPSLFGPVAAFLAWNRLPARIIVGTLAYLTFPIVVDIMESYTTVDVIQDSAAELSFYDRLLILATGNEQGAENGIVLSIDEDNRDRLATLVNLYLPGISIVLGTYFSLTLDILYRRFSSLQETVALEASTLAYCFQLLLSLFDKDRKNLIESAQSVADQVHVLVKESRGKEMMRTVYNDPYSDILRIVQNYSRKTGTLSQPQDASLVGVIRDCVRQLYSLRTQRLNYEANGLAPAHFDLMTFLAGLLLVGIALGTVATAQTNGIPSEVSRILFSALVVCYTTIYEMAYDLNRPFDGIYQIRRSGAAMHLLQIKHMVASHPVLRDHITFDPLVDEEADDTEVPVVDDLTQKDIWYN